MLSDMRFSVLPVVCVLAGLCVSAPAQTANGQQGSTAPAATPATGQSAPAATQPAAPLKLENLPADPHTPTPEQLAEQKRQQQIAAINRMVTAQARWGAPISSPGIVLNMKETGRTKTPAGTEITYQLAATGFTAGEKLTLTRWPLDGNIQTVLDGLTVGPSGQAICAASSPVTDATAGVTACAKTMQPNQPVEVKTTAGLGEAIRVALIDPEQKRGAAASVVPFPLSGEDKGCKVQIILGLKDASLILIEGDGFPPNAAVTLDTESWGDKRPLNAKTNAEGHIIAASLPGVAGHDTGTTTVSYKGATCAPSLTFPWGKGSYQAQ